MADILVIFLLSNLYRSHAQYNACCIYLEQTFVYRADVQLIFKNSRRSKKVHIKFKSEKILEADSALRNRYSNSKHLVKIVHDFKL